LLARYRRHKKNWRVRLTMNAKIENDTHSIIRTIDTKSSTVGKKRNEIL
jgi:hypothetical protein